MTLSTLIEKNNDPVDVNFLPRNNFNSNAYRGNFNPRPFPGNSSNNYGNSYKNSFPTKKIKLPYESIMGATYGLHTKDDIT